MTANLPRNRKQPLTAAEREVWETHSGLSNSSQELRGLLPPTLCPALPWILSRQPPR